MKDPQESEGGGHRLLVVANRTCPCPGVHDDVANRVADHSAAEVLLLAPALTDRVSYFVSAIDEAISDADQRVRDGLKELESRGVNAKGMVGDADPWQAIGDAMAQFEPDELLIATFPEDKSHWMEKGLLEMARNDLKLPVHHVTSVYGLEQD